MCAVAMTELIAGTPTLTTTIDEIVEVGTDTYTYWATIDDPEARDIYSFRPGQINMLGVFGVGEVPISISGDPDFKEQVGHTVRACGRVTNVMADLSVGDTLTIRGPFGRPWPIERAHGGDLVIFAGGLGLAPLRSAIWHAVRHRGAFRRVILLVGAKDPSEILFREDLEQWRMGAEGLEVFLTVDHPNHSWPYSSGVVSSLIPDANLDPKATTVFMCGPEVMMLHGLHDLEAMGIPEERLWLTLERNMHCGVRLCGHCQMGPYFVCADGPIFGWGEIRHVLKGVGQ